MSAKLQSPPATARPAKIVIAGVYLLYLAVVIRTLANPFIRARLPAYLALEFLYLILFTVVLFRAPQKTSWRHLYFICQSLIILFLIWLRPKFDFIVVLFILLSFQAVLIFTGRPRWLWVAIFTLLTGVSLVLGLGVLQGLSLALMPMTVCIVFPAYVSVMQDVEAGVRQNDTLLEDLRRINQQLTDSAGQVEELSAIQERDRLARELHDSVSQTIFSINLYTRSAQILLDRDPERVRPQLEKLQVLTHSALEEMRSLIAELRPPDGNATTIPPSQVRSP